MKSSVSNRYSKEFKIEAVELAMSLGNVTKAAREKEVHQNTVRRWKREFEEGTLKDDNFEELNESPPSISKEHMQEKIISNEDEKNTNEMVENQLLSSPHELSVSSSEIEKYKALYIKTKEEAERLIQLNRELNKELSEAQISIGELFTEIRKLKKHN